MDDIELLSGVLTKTGDLIEGVRPDQRSRPTPCPDYDVDALLDHIVGWVQVFEAGSDGRQFEGDPSAFHVGDDPAAEFRASASKLTASWREHGLDREVAISSGNKMPGAMVFNMTVMEYLAHGWDLAVATGQPVPYTEQEAADALVRARATLPPEYQGEGMAFGAVVEVDDDAPAIDRFIGFMGRQP
ncbi:MAG: TIGR03086 family metal-binding protein [Acidimicrobiales bacterium]